MANRVFDIDSVVIHPELRDLKDVIPILYGVPEADWKTNLFGKIQIWSGVSLNDNQVLPFAATWIEEIKYGPISLRTAIKGLRLAMSLKSDVGRFLFQQQERGPVATETVLAMVNVPAIEEVSNTCFELRGGAQQHRVAQNVFVDDSETQMRNAYCFIAAYLMKLLVKDPKNVVAGLPNMKAQFESFYGRSRIVNGFNISFQQATTYKNALLNQDLILLTFSHSLAYTHQHKFNELTRQEAGVLTYLGCDPFSYTGMHSYALMIELEKFTNIPLKNILPQFYCDITAPALDKIAHIARNSDRDMTFRYCTLWGPQYFSSVRSKKCEHLLYTVACAWKVLDPTSKNGDPEKIVAVKNVKLPEDMKRRLKVAGTTIANSLKAEMLSFRPGC